MDRTVAREPPNGPSGPRRFCAVQAFWPKAKTLAQGEFISPEHVKSPPVSIKITTPDGVVIFMSCVDKKDAYAKRFAGDIGRVQLSPFTHFVF